MPPRNAPQAHKSEHDDHGGFTRDLRAMSAMANRRGLLKFMAGAALVPLIARCGSDGTGDGSSNSSSDSSSNSSGDASGTTTGGTTTTDCTTIPEETAGPYPGDGSNSASGSSGTKINALVLDGIVRQDIRSSIGGVTGTADGIELNVTLTILDSSNKCEPLVGYAVYLWHCTQDGKYSLYTVTNQNYLRGVQETDSEGKVTFTTIFPGCYSGRMPHIHFEVYPSIDSATAYGNKIATSQLAFPDAPCQAVYATDGYEASVKNYAAISFKTDNVFSDGVTLQVATVTGDVDNGYTAALTVAVEG